MVAEAGQEGALSPAKAWAMLGATAAVFAGVLALARFSMDQGLAPFPKSPEFLEERARELVRSIGYTDEPADEAFWWERESDYLTYGAAHEPSTEWRRSLSRTDPHPWWFWRRQSPRFLIAENRFAGTAIGPTNPALEVSGMVNLALDARGNLMRLRAVPPQVESPGADATAPDWTPFFAAAGLDPAKFKPSGPRWLPPEPFDARADWDGAYASRPGVPLHVSAASLRGKPVSFEVLGPWNIPERMQEQRLPGTSWSNAAFLGFVLSIWAAALFLARRNLRLGRGDRRGAFRIAAFVFAAGVLYWCFSAHHVPTQDEAWMFLNYSSFAVFLGAFVWLAYVAIEPIVRRHWPELLFSWSRLLARRFRDPLVGRDVLAGILFGGAMTLCAEIAYSLPTWMDLTGVGTLDPSGSTMASVAGAAADLFAVGFNAPLYALGLMTILALSLVLLRRRWLAVGMTGILLLGLAQIGENYAVEIPAVVVIAALILFVAVRFGILAFTVALFVQRLVALEPLTLELSRWYAARGLFFVALILALALWAFRVALGGQFAFRTRELEA
jgi:hypothetical protein